MSIRFQADNDLKFGIVKAMRRRERFLDLKADSDLNFWTVPHWKDACWFHMTAARCLIPSAHLATGKSSPGLLIVSQGAAIGQVVKSLVYVWALTDPIELLYQAHYLPSLSRHIFTR